MLAKPLLKTALSWIAIVAMAAACAATPDAPSASANVAPDAPTVAQAQAYVENAERELANLADNENHTGWVYETYINHDTEWLLQRVAAAGTEARVRLASGAAQFQGLELPADVRRKIDLLRLSLTLPAPQRLGAADELAQITTRLASIYSTGRIDYQGRQVALDELESLMGTVRDPARLEEMWTEWHAVAAPMAGDYARMVEVANDGAQGLGFPNVGDYWLSKGVLRYAEFCWDFMRFALGLRQARLFCRRGGAICAIWDNAGALRA